LEVQILVRFTREELDEASKLLFIAKLLQLAYARIHLTPVGVSLGSVQERLHRFDAVLEELIGDRMEGEVCQVCG
jgi:hypothetical protein